MLLSSLLASAFFLLDFNGVLASVNFPPIPKDKTTPVQQRIAFKGNNEVSVGWNTYEKLNQTCVQYGTSKTRLTSKACSKSSVTYNTSRTYSNAVTLTGLRPATKYYYKILSGNSTVESFTSSRTAGDPTPFNMDVVIDLGVYGENGFTTAKRDTVPQISPELQHQTIGALARTIDDYEFVIHPGDFAYADDWWETPSNLGDGSEAYEAILENFYDQLAPVASIKPYMTGPGNHEADCTEIDYTSGLCPSGQQNFSDYINRFSQLMPTTFTSESFNNVARGNAERAAALALPPFWYSFEYGMAHIVMFDTETDFTDAPDGPGGSAVLDAGPFGTTGQQVDFLQADLASVDRSVTPWVIVAGHRPWYSTTSNVCEPCQAAFEDLFYEYGVDLAIFGHVHNSQRFNPIYNGTFDPNGLDNPKAPMYIIAGGAGNIEGLSSASGSGTPNEFAYDSDFSYASVKFMSRTQLGVEFIKSSTRQVLDSSVLTKAHKHKFVVQS